MGHSPAGRAAAGHVRTTTCPSGRGMTPHRRISGNSLISRRSAPGRPGRATVARRGAGKDSRARRRSRAVTVTPSRPLAAATRRAASRRQAATAAVSTATDTQAAGRAPQTWPGQAGQDQSWPGQAAQQEPDWPGQAPWPELQAPSGPQAQAPQQQAPQQQAQQPPKQMDPQDEDVPSWAEPDSVEAFSARWHRRGLDSRGERRASGASGGGCGSPSAAWWPSLPPGSATC